MKGVKAGALADAPHEAKIPSVSTSYNDWPNEDGFETFQEQTEPVELKVSGRIPAYAAGVLYRTGPGGHQIATEKDSTFSVSHWFDGFSQTHRFVLDPPTQGKHIQRVTYNSRHTCNQLIEEIRRQGKNARLTFGQKQDPCETYFKKLMSSFQALAPDDSKGVSDVNVGVTLKPNLPTSWQQNTENVTKDPAHGIENLWQKTDNATLQAVNPITLEPTEIARQTKLDPSLRGPFTGAHTRTDPVTSDWYNYNLEVGRRPVYRVFKVSAKTGETTILGTLTGGNIRAAYLHSFMLTERYVVLCIYNAYYTKGGMTVLWTKNLLDAMEYDASKKNIWLVIDRIGDQGLVGIYESDPFFAFHPVNAWDVPSETEKGKFDIVADIPVYDSLDVLKRFYYDNMKSTSSGALNYVGDKKGNARAMLRRFKLPAVGSTTISTTNQPGHVETLFKAPSSDSLELPSFNPKYATKPSRYIFGVSDRGNSTFLDGLLKYDTQTQTSQAWIVHAQSPGEPIFLPDPQGVDEDDGVLLSVVLDGTRGKSYLLVMDAKSFTEVGRAEMDSVVGFGFHGTHISHV